MEPGAFDHFLARATGLLVGLGTPLGLLYLAWGAFKGLASGGTERALQELVKRAIILGILVGVLTHLPGVFDLAHHLGDALVAAVLDSSRGLFD